MNKLILLIQMYLRAAACLYGCIKLESLHSIFCMQNPPIPLAQFYSLARKAENPAEIFRLIGDHDIYDRQIPVNIAELLVVHRQYCYATWDELLTLQRSHEGKPVRILPKGTFLHYASLRYIPDSPEIRALGNLLGKYADGCLPLHHILREAVWLARKDCTAANFLAEMQRLGCDFGDLPNRRQAVDLYTQVYNTVPKDIHNGNTECELRSLPIDPQLKGQRYYLWFCHPKENTGLDVSQQEWMASVPFTGKTLRQAFEERCMASTQLPCRFYDLCFCGSGLFHCDCCGKR